MTITSPVLVEGRTMARIHICASTRTQISRSVLQEASKKSSPFAQCVKGYDLHVQQVRGLGSC
jgi:hypothetical protein